MSEAIMHSELPQLTPQLEVLPSITPTARELSNEYIETRKKFLASEKIEGDALEQIQQEVGAWAKTITELNVTEPFSYEDYAFPSKEKISLRYNLLTEYLQSHYPDVVSEIEVEASRLFVESSFAMYEETPQNGEIHPDADGSFAFVVPTRLSRKSTEYGAEVEPIMPVLRYLPNELRAAFAVGLPPLILDTYSEEADGKRGYLVLSPIWTDMMEDLPLGEAYEAAVKRVNDTVNFAYGRLGAEIQGLGAIIPALTKFGQTIEHDKVITTTGHGGTIQLIMNTMERAVAEEYITAGQLDKIGVLGLGSIGESIAEITRDRLPDAEINVFDIREEKTAKVAKSIGGIAASSIAEVIRNSEVIISAVTSHIDVEELGLTAEDLEGKLIIDDSQPCSFTPEQVEKLGGTVAWVIGRNSIERTSYNFGGSMADPTKEIFGCEAEAATLASKYRDLQKAGVTREDALSTVNEIALQGPVNPDKVRAIARVFDEYNVAAAPLQAFGKYLRD